MTCPECGAGRQVPGELCRRCKDWRAPTVARTPYRDPNPPPWHLVRLTADPLTRAALTEPPEPPHDPTPEERAHARRVLAEARAKLAARREAA